MGVSNRQQTPRHTWVLPKWFMGTMPALTSFLEKYPLGIGFGVWILRAVGIPLFTNNPISGVIMLIALFYNSAYQTICGLIAVVTSLITAVLLLKDSSEVHMGHNIFNAFLMGLVVPLLVDNQGAWSWKIILAVAVLGVISCLFSKTLDSFFVLWKLPALNLSFNITAALFASAVHLGSQNVVAYRVIAMSPSDLAINTDYGNITWNKVGEGILLSIGQAVGVSSLVSSGILLAAVVIASPVSAVMLTVGATLGTFTGLLLGAPLPLIYAGAYGYNSALSCAALGGFLLVLSRGTLFITFVAGILASMFYGFGVRALDALQVPIVAFPFCITVQMMLLAAEHVRWTPRTKEISYPEQHLADWIRNRKVKNPNNGEIEMEACM